jgi:hypothetical protein
MPQRAPRARIVIGLLVGAVATNLAACTVEWAEAARGVGSRCPRAKGSAGGVVWPGLRQPPERC